MRLRALIRWWPLLLCCLSFLMGCSLTSANVEPALPTGRINDSDTVVYRADGQPVVANKVVDLIAILLSFLGDPRAVVGKLLTDSTLTIRATNTPASGANDVRTRRLLLVIPKFRGVGTYILPPASGSGPAITLPRRTTRSTFPRAAVRASPLATYTRSYLGSPPRLR